MIRILLILLAIVCTIFSGCSPAPDTGANAVGNSASDASSAEVAELRAMMPKIEPFFQKMGKPQSYDWLGSHNEPGQTFDQYLAADAPRPTAQRQTIYVLPLGTFTDEQKKIVSTTADYLKAFYDLPVKELPSRPMPPAQKDGDIRITSIRGVSKLKNQYRTGFIMDSVLKPSLPADAAALIAFTVEDLYPDKTMSFVFGQASMSDRVGVWSLFRLQQDADHDKFLRRTLKIAAHETGHMFGFWHCTKYECVMSGTNYLGETDRRPIDACPEDTAKICLISRSDPVKRYKALADFCRKNGLADEAASFDKKAAAVSK